MKLTEILENIRALDLVGDDVVTVERADLVKLANRIQVLTQDNIRITALLEKANRRADRITIEALAIPPMPKALREYAIKTYKEGK